MNETYVELLNALIEKRIAEVGSPEDSKRQVHATLKGLIKTEAWFIVSAIDNIIRNL